jgi:hypothetical protein
VLSAEGTFRFYFNRVQEFPRAWCISNVEHTWELTVTAVNFYRVKAITCTEKRDQDAAKWNPPAGWIEVSGKLEVYRDGEALIEGYE